MVDYRSEPSASRDGQGVAKRAWEMYSRGVNKVAGPVLHPMLRPLAEAWSVSKVSDLLGFWLLWHLEGGFDGLRRHGMSERTVYRKIGEFRKYFGEHPDDFTLPGVAIDVRSYIASGEKTSKTD
jgi:hypothetical protein